MTTSAQQLRDSVAYRQAQQALLDATLVASRSIQGVRPPSSDATLKSSFAAQLDRFTQERGRALYFPFLGSGLGNGPWVELADGSVKYDLITGIGINFFGHNEPELLRATLDALPSDLMQGNLQPGIEMPDLLSALLARTGREQGCRLAHGWLTTCGTMANEIALKIIRQKHFPATKVFAFSDCFAGRSTAMQEITDNAKYREGQPTYGEVEYLPFYKKEWGLERSLSLVTTHLEWALARHPGKFAGLMMEPVQGEGGFNYAPREWYVGVFEAAKRAGLAVWLDEIQTFGRTGKLFAYQTFGLERWVDVVSVAKMFQASAVLFAAEYNPKPGLVAGTFTGSSAQLRAAKRTLELLEERGLLTRGEQVGRIAQLSCAFAGHLERLRQGSCRGRMGEYRAIGGMIAFQPFDGTMDQVKRVLLKLFDLGAVAFYCGHDPYLIRMLPPFGVMTEEHLSEVAGLIERALLES